jgi:hypothetical protein
MRSGLTESIKRLAGKGGVASAVEDLVTNPSVAGIDQRIDAAVEHIEAALQRPQPEASTPPAPTSPPTRAAAPSSPSKPAPGSAKSHKGGPASDEDRYVVPGLVQNVPLTPSSAPRGIGAASNWIPGSGTTASRWGTVRFAQPSESPSASVPTPMPMMVPAMT